MPITQETLYFRSQGQEFGPFSHDALESMYAGGLLSVDCEVRRDGASAWIKASRFFHVGHPAAPKSQGLSGDQMDALSSPLAVASSIDDLELDSSSPAPSSRPVRPVEPHWICRVLGQEFGPLDFIGLRDMAERGVLSPTDRVRSDGDAKWVLADSIPKLFDGIARSTAPVSASSQTNGFVSPQRAMVKKAPVAKEPLENKAEQKTPAATVPSPTVPSATETETKVEIDRPTQLPAVAPPPAPASAHRPSEPTTLPMTPPASVPRPPMGGWAPPRQGPAPRIPPAARKSKPSFEAPNIDYKKILLVVGGLLIAGAGYWYFGPASKTRLAETYYQKLYELHLRVSAADGPTEQVTIVKSFLKNSGEMRQEMIEKLDASRPHTKALMQCLMIILPAMSEHGPDKIREDLQQFDSALKTAAADIHS